MGRGSRHVRVCMHRCGVVDPPRLYWMRSFVLPISWASQRRCPCLSSPWSDVHVDMLICELARRHGLVAAAIVLIYWMCGFGASD
jgi:hypothetical protein